MFEKSVAKWFVYKDAANGIEYLEGVKKVGGTTYTMEIKVLNQQFANYRIYGYKDEAGNFIFDYFGKALH